MWREIRYTVKCRERAGRRTLELVTTTISHWVDNEMFAGSSGATAPVTNPATGVVTGQVALAVVADARTVIDAAAAAFPAWRDTSLAKRTAVLFRFRELLNDRKGELAEIITAEHGKVVSDALGEVSRGQEVVEFACGIPHLLKGGYTENASTNVDVYSMRQPLGPVAIISPFNFPAMVPMWFFPIAIATGNTVVLKPSEKDPSAALWLADLWKEAGLPAGVFNVLHGDKTAVDELLTNPAIKSVSFVGSTPIAQYVYATGTAAGKRVQALGGAKNHAVILPDADLDLAADAMVNAGFGSAGERCMAISARASPSAPSPMTWSPKSLNAPPPSKPATAPTTPTWAPWSPLRTATKSPPTSTPAKPPAPRSSSTAAPHQTPATGPRRILAGPHAARQRHPRHERLHRRNLRPRALGAARRHLRRKPCT